MTNETADSDKYTDRFCNPLRKSQRNSEWRFFVHQTGVDFGTPFLCTMNAPLFLSILIAAALNMAVGTIWYMPFIFGNIWMKEVGIRKEKTSTQDMISGMVTAFLCSMVTAYVLLLIPRAFAGSIGDMVTTVFVVWVGFIAAVRLSHFAFERKSFRLFWITSLHDLVGLLAMGFFFYYWK